MADPSPKRIQRRRSKGWRMPPGAVYVGRPTRWGNVYTVEPSSREWLAQSNVAPGICFSTSLAGATRFAVDAFRRYVSRNGDLRAEIRAELGGKDLACWCPLDQPCHADVLLEIANAD
jgi:hypothetical protein